MSRPIVVIVCMTSSSESWEPQQRPHSWHSRAGGGAVHSIKSGHREPFGRCPLYPEIPACPGRQEIAASAGRRSAPATTAARGSAQRANVAPHNAPGDKASESISKVAALLLLALLESGDLPIAIGRDRVAHSVGH